MIQKLYFDESTSSLDLDTEKAIISEINLLKVKLLLLFHIVILH